MTTVFCFACEQPIRLERSPLVGEIIFCSCCGTEFEVISLEPIELDWIYLEPNTRETDRKRGKLGRKKVSW